MGNNGVKVSFEDLDRAAEEQPGQTLAEEAPPKETKPTTEEAPPEETPPEEPPKEEIPEIEEPADNAERSKLGRRVSAIESSIQTLVEEFRASMRTPGKEQPLNDEEETVPTSTWPDEDEESYVTRKDLTGFLQNMKMREAREADKAKKETDKYISDYNAVFKELGQTVEQDFHDEVLQEMKAHHNLKRSNSGALDAELNYLKAKDTVLQKKMADPKNPLDKNKDKILKNLGGPSDTIVTEKTETPIKLDKYAEDFIAKVGMSSDSVKRALDGKARSGLMGGKI